MKVLRIVSRGNVVYVARRLLCIFWYRVSPKYRTNIEAWNWVRSQGVEESLLTRGR